MAADATASWLVISKEFGAFCWPCFLLAPLIQSLWLAVERSRQGRADTLTLHSGQELLRKQIGSILKRWDAVEQHGRPNGRNLPLGQIFIKGVRWWGDPSVGLPIRLPTEIAVCEQWSSAGDSAKTSLSCQWSTAESASISLVVYSSTHLADISKLCKMKCFFIIQVWMCIKVHWDEKDESTLSDHASFDGQMKTQNRFTGLACQQELVPCEDISTPSIDHIQAFVSTF